MQAKPSPGSLQTLRFSFLPSRSTGQSSRAGGSGARSIPASRRGRTPATGGPLRSGLRGCRAALSGERAPRRRPPARRIPREWALAPASRRDGTGRGPGCRGRRCPGAGRDRPGLPGTARQDEGASGSAYPEAAAPVEAPGRSQPAGTRRCAKGAQRARQRSGVCAAPRQGRLLPTGRAAALPVPRTGAPRGPGRSGNGPGGEKHPAAGRAPAAALSPSCRRRAGRGAGSAARGAEGPRAQEGLPPRSGPGAAGRGGPGSAGCAEPRAAGGAGFDGARRRLARAPPARALRGRKESGLERPRSALPSPRRRKTLVVTETLPSPRRKGFLVAGN